MLSLRTRRRRTELNVVMDLSVLRCITSVLASVSICLTHCLCGCEYRRLFWLLNIESFHRMRRLIHNSSSAYVQRLSRECTSRIGVSLIDCAFSMYGVEGCCRKTSVVGMVVPLMHVRPVEGGTIESHIKIDDGRIVNDDIKMEMIVCLSDVDLERRICMRSTRLSL